MIGGDIWKTISVGACGALVFWRSSSQCAVAVAPWTQSLVGNELEVDPRPVTRPYSLLRRIDGHWLYITLLYLYGLKYIQEYERKDATMNAMSDTKASLGFALEI